MLVVTPECATTETVEAISAALTEKGFEVRDTRSEVRPRHATALGRKG